MGEAEALLRTDLGQIGTEPISLTKFLEQDKLVKPEQGYAAGGYVRDMKDGGYIY